MTKNKLTKDEIEERNKAISGLQPTEHELNIYEEYKLRGLTAEKVGRLYNCSESNIRSVVHHYRKKVTRMENSLRWLAEQINKYSDDEYVVARKDSDTGEIEALTDNCEGKEDELQELIE